MRFNCIVMLIVVCECFHLLKIKGNYFENEFVWEIRINDHIFGPFEAGYPEAVQIKAAFWKTLLIRCDSGILDLVRKHAFCKQISLVTMLFTVEL